MAIESFDGLLYLFFIVPTRVSGNDPIAVSASGTQAVTGSI